MNEDEPMRSNRRLLIVFAVLLGSGCAKSTVGNPADGAAPNTGGTAGVGGIMSTRLSSDGLATSGGASASGGPATGGQVATGGIAGAAGTKSAGGPGDAGIGGTDSGGISGTGDGAAGAACGTHAPFGTQMRASTIGSLKGAYEGPATVERSTTDDLVLAFLPAGRKLPLHATLTGLNPMPLLPLGAQVWLSKSPAGDAPYGTSGGPPAWSFAVRARQGGRLLLAAVFRASDLNPSPILIDNPTAACTTTDPEFCSKGGMIDYNTVDVHGDTTVVIGDSQTATVPIGGVDYDVRVSAQMPVKGTGTVGCADYVAVGGISVDIRAHDLASQAASLNVGSVPACARGNDLSRNVSVGITDAQPPYDGPIFYRRRFPDQPNCFLFDTVAPPAQIYVCAAPDLFSEPAPGQEFMAIVPNYFVGALRGPQHGPLVLAVASAPAPFSATDAAIIEQTIGIGMQAQARCDYANLGESGSSATSLWDLVFATTPTTRLATETVGTVPIAGVNHHVWFSSQSYQISLQVF
jgi:hypothetical protein